MWGSASVYKAMNILFLFEGIDVQLRKVKTLFLKKYLIWFE